MGLIILPNGAFAFQCKDAEACMIASLESFDDYEYYWQIMQLDQEAQAYLDTLDPNDEPAPRWPEGTELMGDMDWTEGAITREA